MNPGDAGSKYGDEEGRRHPVKLHKREVTALRQLVRLGRHQSRAAKIMWSLCCVLARATAITLRRLSCGTGAQLQA